MRTAKGASPGPSVRAFRLGVRSLDLALFLLRDNACASSEDFLERGSERARPARCSRKERSSSRL